MDYLGFESAEVMCGVVIHPHDLPPAVGKRRENCQQWLVTISRFCQGRRAVDDHESRSATVLCLALPARARRY